MNIGRPESARRNGKTGSCKVLAAAVANDQRYDRREVRQNEQELIRQAWIKRLQTNLRRFSEAKSE